MLNTIKRFWALCLDTHMKLALYKYAIIYIYIYICVCVCVCVGVISCKPQCVKCNRIFYYKSITFDTHHTCLNGMFGWRYSIHPTAWIEGQGLRLRCFHQYNCHPQLASVPKMACLIGSTDHLWHFAWLGICLYNTSKLWQASHDILKFVQLPLPPSISLKMRC